MKFLSAIIAVLVCFTFFACSSSHHYLELCVTSELQDVAIGKVQSSSEECEVHEVRYVCVKCEEGIAYNTKEECERKPLIRRMICPSGQNSSNTVGDDGTKFHREVLY